MKINSKLGSSKFFQFKSSKKSVFVISSQVESQQYSWKESWKKQTSEKLFRIATSYDRSGHNWKWLYPQIFPAIILNIPISSLQAPLTSHQTQEQ